MTSVEAGHVGPQDANQADAQLDAHDAGTAEAHLPSSAAQQQQAEATSEDATTTAAQPPPEAPMSKNALKRLRRQQEWEDGKEDRRKRRREKRHDRRERQREERATLLAGGADPAAVVPRRKQQQAGVTLVPVALVVDCDFEAYMNDKELVSLANQATRCYSDNRNARYKAHLWMAGWAGKIRDRFRDVLGDQHQHWKGVGFVEGDFLACADEARQRMKERPGEMVAPLQRSRRRDEAAHNGEEKGVDGEGPSGGSSWIKDAPGDEPFPLPGPEPVLNEAYRDVVYLTSESPYTLQRLEPHTSYVVGGLVDKNREKGLCYRRARERGIRTARLPIGQFMVLQSRQVLATNHVVEIMLKWLECEDWGQAFMAVIPKRKGGRLIEDGGAAEGEDEDEAGDESVIDKDDGTVETMATVVDDEAQPEAGVIEPRDDKSR
ncbi:tRNA (Guanine-1)-methyltransferase [Hirsutella rhossiliensis]|uniref:tRNA (guanine(9)-N1)-methyltransferase n=1 Tax=Hirsutella rhossiliensis TaxID=111463 RepID=A0A9P8MMF4_9HYPO|nr:tRNA (Guanine-1)-methyltransferase domain-containing protein [Hirsutella rhossiliensis]KAH0958028.1 tRNA (Guanine-1)-methyltransferase domain-containing protein [Hirsutella rhossiliensis]